jgi:S1-C subfamily serine protease
MMKKYSIYALFCLLVVSITSCTSGCAVLGSSGITPRKLPRAAFVQVQQAVELEGCGLDTITKEEKCQKVTMRSVSSGAYVFISEVAEDVAYVLTAGHSCSNKSPKEQMVDGFKIKNLGSSFIVVDLNGLKHKGEVVKVTTRYDLCLLRVHNILVKPPILRPAAKAPRIGEEVTNLAAPHGLYWPGAVLIFKGIFSGYHKRGYSMYTIPTKPGSSGSPILNKNNKLIGVIFAGYPTIENVGLSSPLVAVKIFLKKSIALGEMKLWEENNTPKKDTTIIRNWAEEMKAKLDIIFGNSK